MLYQIRVKGVLDETWADWLGHIDIQTERAGDTGPITTLTVDLTDQAALFGLLDHVRDLNLALVSVNPAPESAQPA